MSLKKYIEQQNRYASWFKKDPYPEPAALTVVQIQDLADQLEADLSPENLCCDGELRGAKLRAKSNMLNGAKADLQRLAEGKGYTILDPWRAFI